MNPKLADFQDLFLQTIHVPWESHALGDEVSTRAWGSVRSDFTKIPLRTQSEVNGGVKDLNANI